MAQAAEEERLVALRQVGARGMRGMHAGAYVAAEGCGRASAAGRPQQHGECRALRRLRHAAQRFTAARPPHPASQFYKEAWAFLRPQDHLWCSAGHPRGAWAAAPHASSA